MSGGVAAVFLVECQCPYAVLLAQPGFVPNDVLIRVEMMKALWHSVAERCRVGVGACMLLRPGTLPVRGRQDARRSAARRMFIEGRLDPLLAWSVFERPPVPSFTLPALARRLSLAQRWLRLWLARRNRLPIDRVCIAQALCEFELKRFDLMALVIDFNLQFEAVNDADAIVESMSIAAAAWRLCQGAEAMTA